MLRLLLITILLLTFFKGLAQIDTNQIESTNRELIYPTSYVTGLGPIVGYRGFSNHFGEIGLTTAGFGHGVVGIELSYLNNFGQADENISGFSVGVYRGFAFFESGVLGTLFTNFDQSKFYIKPYIGLGLGGVVTIGYGYNLSVGQFQLKDQINRHEFRLICRVPFVML